MRPGKPAPLTCNQRGEPLHLCPTRLRWLDRAALIRLRNRPKWRGRDTSECWTPSLGSYTANMKVLLSILALATLVTSSKGKIILHFFFIWVGHKGTIAFFLGGGSRDAVIVSLSLFPSICAYIAKQSYPFLILLLYLLRTKWISSLIFLPYLQKPISYLYTFIQFPLSLPMAGPA